MVPLVPELLSPRDRLRAGLHHRRAIMPACYSSKPHPYADSSCAEEGAPWHA